MVNVYTKLFSPTALALGSSAHLSFGADRRPMEQVPEKFRSGSGAEVPEKLATPPQRDKSQSVPPAPPRDLEPDKLR